MPFVGEHEWNTKMQQLNRFWYDTAVGRVYTSITVESDNRSHFFSWRYGNRFNETVFKCSEQLDPVSGRLSTVISQVIDEDCFNLKSFLTVQVNTDQSIDLYAFQNNVNQGSFIRYRSLIQKGQRIGGDLLRALFGLSSVLKSSSPSYGDFHVAEMAAPLTRRYGASLTNYVDKWIFVSAGYG